MKIGFVVPGFSADETDWCIPAHTDLVRELARVHEVHVFAMRYPHRVDTYARGGAVVHSFNGVGRRGLSSAQLWRNVMKDLAREHACGAFDVLQAIFGSEAGCLTVLAGRRLRVPSIVWLVDGELVGLRDIGYGADLIARQRWMNALVLRFADRVLCGCAATTRAARERVPASRRARIETLPLAVNTKRFAPDQTVPRAAHFLNVGSLLPVKDQFTLLNAMARMRAAMPHAHLTIIGAGPLDADLERAVHKWNLGSAVTFLGNVAHDALPAAYHAAAVFVQSSRHEGQGMALLEAAASGCAVCGTNVGALRDLAERSAAVVCAAGDANALANAMRRACQERATLALQARRIVEREYSLEWIGARLNAVYAQLCLGTDPYREPPIVTA